MSAANLSVGQWLDEAITAAREVATGVLGCEGMDVAGKGTKITLAAGSFIPMMTKQCSLQVGFISTLEGCQKLAAALLCMEPGDGPPSESDMADAIGEIVNIIAGAVQRAVGDRVSAELGLPIFIDGEVRQGQMSDIAVAGVQLGDVAGEIVVLMGPSNARNR